MGSNMGMQMFQQLRGMFPTDYQFATDYQFE